jgi:hypothetical protein
MQGCGSRFGVADVRTIPPSFTSRCLDICSVARSHRRTATVPRRACISQAGWNITRKCHSPGWTRITAAAFPDAGSRSDREQGGGCVLGGSGAWKWTMPLSVVFCRLRMSDHSADDTTTFIAYEAGSRMHRDPAMPRVSVNPTSGHWRLMATAPTPVGGEWNPCHSAPSSKYGLSCG